MEVSRLRWILPCVGWVGQRGCGFSSEEDVPCVDRCRVASTWEDVEDGQQDEMHPKSPSFPPIASERSFVPLSIVHREIETFHRASQKAIFKACGTRSFGPAQLDLPRSLGTGKGSGTCGRFVAPLGSQPPIRSVGILFATSPS